MYSNSYVYKFIQQVIQDLSKDVKHYLFVKHYNSITLTRETIEAAIPECGNEMILCHDFSSSQMQSAYEPFLIWIRDLYNAFFKDVEPEDFVDACHVYPLQKQIFISYLRDGICKREEDVILPEIPYEQTRMYQSILESLGYIAAKQPLVLVLNHTQYASKSVIDLLRAFIEKDSIRNLGIIVIYNEVIPVISYAQQSWKELIKLVEKQHYLIDWGVTEKQQPVVPTLRFLPHSALIASYLPIIHNMIYTLAIEQADYYLDILYRKLEVEHSFVAKETKEELLYLYSLTTLYLGDYSKALLLLEKLKGIIDSKTEPVIYFEMVYLSGVAYTYNGLYNMAARMAKECQLLVPEENKDYYTFKAKLLDYIVVLRGWTAIFFNEFHFDDIDGFCELAKKYNYLNHLAHVYTYGYGNEASFFQNGNTLYLTEEKLMILQRGVDLALRLNNIYFAMESYKKNSFVVSAYGHFELTEQYYLECIKLLKDLNNPVEEANIYNGLGYNSSVSGDYEKANNYYNKALSIFYRLSMMDGICETIYNKVINAILAEDYENAIIYVTKCLEILAKMKQFKLNVCNASKLYGLAALAYFRLASEYNCSLHLASAKRYLSHLLDTKDESKFFLWDDDLFLYYYVTGLLNKKSKDYDYAQSDFDHAYYHMMRSKGNLFFSYHQFAVDQADLFTILGKKEEAATLLEQCLEYEESHKFKQQARKITRVLDKEESEDMPLFLGMGEVTIEMVDELANQMAAKAELERKEKHIDFLSTCQNMISQEQDKQSLIFTTMNHIQNHFLFDQMILLSGNKEQGEIEPFYLKEAFDLTKEHIATITSKLADYPAGFVVSRTEKRYEEFYDITSIFGVDEIASFVCIPIIMDNEIRDILIGYTKMQDNFTANVSLLTEGDLTILRFSFKQLVDSIDRIDFNQKILEYNNELQAMNNKLHESAVTDILTSLLNRQGFMKLVGAIPNDSGYTEESKSLHMTILYIDLDSFKYYNDTFGHAVGDRILVGFANILQKIASKGGYAVRYGGDEFLLALPDTSIEKAEETAKSIYIELEQQNYFIDQIPHDDDTVIDIPKEHLISCSIGIASTDYKGGCSINDTLKHADEALYYVKKHEKRSYRIWSES
ncbi:MAG: diguanylate cyclase [Clostridiales bacterium]|nr:diguanylate cyclase [Clostridiales bacterium]